MKKIYSKPEIVFEDFTMSTSIAGNCDSIVGNPTQGNCAVIGTGNIAVFDGTISACVYKPGDLGGIEDQWDGYCYHVPVDTANLFNS